MKQVKIINKISHYKLIFQNSNKVELLILSIIRKEIKIYWNYGSD